MDPSLLPLKLSIVTSSKKGKSQTTNLGPYGNERRNIFGHQLNKQ